MNNFRPFVRLALAVILFVATFATRASVVVFTSNTAIGPGVTTYDGTSIIISNCTVTVDGSHAFANVLVGAGSILTHSSATNAILVSNVFNVTNEPQVLSSTNFATLLNTNVISALAVTDLTQTSNYLSGVDYIIATNLANGLQLARTATSSIPDGSTVLVSYTWSSTISAGLNLTVTGNFTVASGGSVMAGGLGYGPSLGAGAGMSSIGTFFDGSGAGHGGQGGTSSSLVAVGSCYDSLYQPTQTGSGGGASYAGAGGSGGGLVQIVAGEAVDIEGTISVNGTDAMNSRAGGGSGGGISIITTNMMGAGTITANGGAGEAGHGGGGGGGMISIQCAANTFSGTMTAFGGTGFANGGAGTIFIRSAGQNGLLRMDNGGRGGTSSSITLPSLADVVISNNAQVQAVNPFNAGDLTISTNGVLLGQYQTQITVSATNLTVQAGGVLAVDMEGYPAGSGLGAGTAYSSGNTFVPCGGGGYGGYGGVGSVSNAIGGSTYDTQTAPSLLGSGGGSVSTSLGGGGGGAVQLLVSANLQVDGRISANGGGALSGAGGGGSGGSININCQSLAGAGTISANGGSAIPLGGGGGGGGGRILVSYGTDAFAGNITAYGGGGGGGTNWGGAGTIYLQPVVGTPQLILDNGGNTGGGTPLQSASIASLTVQNGAQAGATSAMIFSSLLVNTNGWLTALSHSTGESFTINGNATFQAGGGFVADSGGFASGSGLGAGNDSTVFPYGGGGAGYGGRGGNAVSNSATGGYGGNDTAYLPSANYAGPGGGGYLFNSVGGNGGGFVQMTVNGTLLLNGLITANGGNGSGEGGGGGAGGGVSLNVGTFTGSGAITVNGGTGANAIGGGGSGGRIAILLNNGTFTGNMTAYGGNGANWGGAGTIYIKTNSAAHGQLIVDNAGHVGADTPYQTSATTDVTLRNGSSSFITSGVSFDNLLVMSNAWLFITNVQASVNASNITVQSGGFIYADGFGSLAGSGSGAGHGSGVLPNDPCSGAGHGGYGANSYSNVFSGGTYYDLVSNPTLAGSGGGSELPYSVGGAGGGLIRMTLTGTLQVNGSLSANGSSGSGVGGGGGSGGALNVSCLTLTGTGTIAANGGNGAGNVGGGGSGGIIAIAFNTNTFGGSYSCAGGGGAAYGAAGPLYFRTNSTSQTQLIVDNAGHLGTNTPASSVTYLIVRNGGTAFVSPSAISVVNLLITSNAWLMGGSSAGGGGGGTLTVTVGGNATLQAGGGMITDAAGSGANIGSGHGNIVTAGLPYQCSGGAHGGYGGMGYNNTPAGGVTYDSTTAPASMGSGGGGFLPDSVGGNGGGYVNLHVSSILQLDGLISANGGNGTGSGGGGGSGGSIQISTGIFNGAGSLTVNGGSGANAYGGGGGGGRITIADTTQNFTGKMTAYGGGGAAYGGAGTIYSKLGILSSGQVLLDNGGNAGTNTTFDPIVTSVIIQNGAIGFLPTTAFWTAQTVVIHTNGGLVQPVGGSQRSITANNITIDAGGIFALDGSGAIAQSGTGPGGFTTSVRGGGGHGGYGGGSLVGGGAYDSIQAPILAGSGGGSFNGTLLDNGGNGGGLMNLSVNGTLTVNGRLSANGSAGGYNSGGGAGGSLNLSSITTLAGSGLIAANGGAGNGQAGGGGGGRIALTCITNLFIGTFSASGGPGAFPGGAGTIYTSLNGTNTLLVGNGGLTGASTPLGSAFALPASLFDLNISGSASVVPITPLPLLKDLTLSAGSILTVPGTQSNLVIAVQNNATLAGSLTVNTFGWPQGNGAGAGASSSSKGAGGGYGGAGGASSSGASGGITNGSALQPVDFGSGGGAGANTASGGSEGGGAIRLSVAGILNVSGNLSANGDLGLQDDSGGGSGGSIWITASSLTGGGNIAAAGGSGAPAGGGGGGGGRISIYAPSNLFTGTTNVNGGSGYNPGQPGTVYLSSAPLVFQVATQSPSGTVSNVVSSVRLTFNEVLNAASVSAADFTITTPNGVLPGSSLTATLTGLSTVQLSFPSQNQLGSYTVQAATTITNIFGAALAQNYSGSFIISLPTISGTVTATNGAPVAGVLLQPNGGLTGATTGINGNYSIGVPAGWNGTVTPSSGSSMFIPGTLSYTNVTASVTGQNFIMVSTLAPSLTTSVSGGNLSFSWMGFTGVTYQAWESTNLVNWVTYGSAIPGTNGLQQISLPLDDSPSVFFRLGASD